MANLERKTIRLGQGKLFAQDKNKAKFSIYLLFSMLLGKGFINVTRVTRTSTLTPGFGVGAKQKQDLCIVAQIGFACLGASRKSREGDCNLVELR